MFHCKNYVCQLISGCVCDCDSCYEAKGLTKVDPTCPQCGYCRHCGRKNEFAPYSPWINIQPYVWPLPATPQWPQGPFWSTTSEINIIPQGSISGSSCDYLQDLKLSSHNC